ncbi:MAG: hypothetical protein U0936_14640 [Planctomycetaceae bacterium]
MHQESPPERSFALCEIAAILTMLSSTSLMVGQATAQNANADTATVQQPLAYELVHGDKRISLGGPSPHRSHGWMMIVICSENQTAGKSQTLRAVRSLTGTIKRSWQLLFGRSKASLMLKRNPWLKGDGWKSIMQTASLCSALENL